MFNVSTETATTSEHQTSYHCRKFLHASLPLTSDEMLWFISFLSLYSHKLEEEFEWLKKSEVLYYSVEKKGNVSSQLKHYNPWSMKCHQQQLQRMKENAKHRNQYSILCSQGISALGRGEDKGGDPSGLEREIGFFKVMVVPGHPAW